MFWCCSEHVCYYFRSLFSIANRTYRFLCYALSCRSMLIEIWYAVRWIGWKNIYYSYASSWLVLLAHSRAHQTCHENLCASDWKMQYGFNGCFMFWSNTHSSLALGREIFYSPSFFLSVLSLRPEECYYASVLLLLCVDAITDRWTLHFSYSLLTKKGRTQLYTKWTEWNKLV